MLTSITIDRVEPFADGREFGVTGAYERVVGRARGELDPKDPRNAVIAGIDKAPLNARGRVEYDTDLYLLAPRIPPEAMARYSTRSTTAAAR
jgi:hypothetical protein